MDRRMNRHENTIRYDATPHHPVSYHIISPTRPRIVRTHWYIPYPSRDTCGDSKELDTTASD